MSDSLEIKLVRLEAQVERNREDINRVFSKLDAMATRFDEHARDTASGINRISSKVENVVILSGKAKTVGAMLLLFAGFLGWLVAQGLSALKAWGT